VRDYFHVSDLAALCAKAAFSPSEGAFKAGSGEGSSIIDLVEMIGEVVGQPIGLAPVSPDTQAVAV
jgi:UDP-glucose 4-epimerase